MKHFKEIIVVLLVIHVLLFGIFVFSPPNNDYDDKKGKFSKEEYNDKRYMSDKKGRYQKEECGDKRDISDKEKKYDTDKPSDLDEGTKRIEDGQEYKSEEARQSVAIVKRSIEDFNQNPKKTLKDVSDGVYVEGDIYVSVIKDGNNVAHPFRKDLENNQISHLVDKLGNRYGEEISNTTEEGKWIEYIFTVPVTNEEAFKSTYCERSNEHIFCAGFYYTR